ncbi:Nn.00g000410.m01.CDS01 [Neocucurbitaria sp. VM-36]
MAQAPARPLIAIVGATGTGKSDLAVDIARKYNGEVINGDAMQLYHGLPVITNKITQEEMKGIPHHLLGCIGLEEETWTVGKFVGEALTVIDEIRSRGKIPILVGGTHYYTQSLLFQDALADEPALNLDQNSKVLPILEEPTDTILAKLREVDPIMANRWHPNERRKIQRSLEIYLRTGKPASQVYDEQRTRRDGSPSSTLDGVPNTHSGLRFPTLLFWVHTNKDVLYPRLDGRIEKMLEKGLLSEVQDLSDFRKDYETRTSTIIDQSRGIWVSIGYKEFRDYQNALTQVPQVQSELATLRTAAVEKTQAATRQYANRQIKWIRIKLLNAVLSAGQQDNIFLLNGSDLSRWEEEVIKPATTITEQFLSGQTLPAPSSLSEVATEMLIPKRAYDLGQRPDLWQKRVCETCGTVAVTENDWSLHIKSRAHRKAVGAKKKLEHTQNTSHKDRKSFQADTLDVLESYVEKLP